MSTGQFLPKLEVKVIENGYQLKSNIHCAIFSKVVE